MQLNVNQNGDIYHSKIDSVEEKMEKDEDVVIDREDIERRASNFGAKIRNENIRIYPEDTKHAKAKKYAQDVWMIILGISPDTLSNIQNELPKDWVALGERTDSKYFNIQKDIRKAIKIIEKDDSEDINKVAQRNAVMYISLVLASMCDIVSLRELMDPQLEIIDNFLNYIVNDDEETCRERFDHTKVKEVFSLYMNNEKNVNVTNLMVSLPAGQGKTAIGIFISLLSLHGRFEDGYQMDDPMYANVHWDTCSKTLTNQAVADFTCVFSTDAFGCIYPLDKEKKPQSLITVGEGVKNPLLYNKYIIITTYEHGDIFTKGDMYERLDKLTKTRKEKIDGEISQRGYYEMGYLHIKDNAITPLDTLRLCVVNDMHNINDGGEMGVDVDNVMISCRNMGIPMLVLNGTLKKNVRDKLMEEFNFSSFSMEEKASKYMRNVSFIKLKKIDDDSLDGGSRKFNENKDSPELHPYFMVMISEVLPYYLKWFTEDKGERISFFVENTKELEMAYAAFVATAYSVVKSFKKLYYDTFSRNNFLNLPKVSFMWDEECLNTFNHYAQEFGAGDWLLINDNPYMILALGLRAGIMLSHSNIFPSDDQSVRTTYEAAYSRELDEEREIVIEENTDLVTPPFRILFSTSIITGVNIKGLSMMFIDPSSFKMMTPSRYLQLIDVLGRYMDGKIYVNVTDNVPVRFMMMPEKDMINIMSNSELSERIFTIFKVKKLKESDPELYKHMSITSEQRKGKGLEGKINGFYTFNTSEMLRMLAGDNQSSFSDFDYINCYEKNIRIKSIFDSIFNSYDHTPTAGKVPGKILCIMHDFFKDENIINTLHKQSKGSFRRPVLSTLLFLPFTYSISYLFTKKGHVFNGQDDYINNLKNYIRKDDLGNKYFDVSLIADTDTENENVYNVMDYKYLLADIINVNDSNAHLTGDSIQKLTYITSTMLATVFTEPEKFFKIWRNSIELVVHKMSAYLISLRKIINIISDYDKRTSIQTYIDYHIKLLNRVVNDSYRQVDAAIKSHKIIGHVVLEFAGETITNIPFNDYVKYYTLPTRIVNGWEKTLTYDVDVNNEQVLKTIRSNLFQIKKK